MSDHADSSDINVADIPAFAGEIHPNEKAYFLAERILLTRDYKHLRRWQIIGVNRADQVAFWVKDLGPASKFRCPEFRIPTMWEHSVAEVQDMAERQRAYDDTLEQWKKDAAGSSTLIKDFLDQHEEATKIVKGESVFGPGVTRQRNGQRRSRRSH